MRRFAVIRPYDPAFRRRVVDFLSRLGFDTAEVPVFTDDMDDAELPAWMKALEPRPDLWLVPFHAHRLGDDSFVDGLGTLAQLADPTLLGRAPILMPVSDFAYASSFPRRHEAFADDHPLLADRIVVMPAAELGSDAVRDALLRALGDL